MDRPRIDPRLQCFDEHELKVVYRVLHAHLLDHPELIDVELFASLQDHLQALATEQGVSVEDHGAWESWLSSDTGPQRGLLRLVTRD